MTVGRRVPAPEIEMRQPNPGDQGTHGPVVIYANLGSFNLNHDVYDMYDCRWRNGLGGPRLCHTHHTQPGLGTFNRKNAPFRE